MCCLCLSGNFKFQFLIPSRSKHREINRDLSFSFLSAFCLLFIFCFFPITLSPFFLSTSVFCQILTMHFGRMGTHASSRLCLRTNSWNCFACYLLIYPHLEILNCNKLILTLKKNKVQSQWRIKLVSIFQHCLYLKLEIPSVINLYSIFQALIFKWHINALSLYCDWFFFWLWGNRKGVFPFSLYYKHLLSGRK